jgi:membrane protease YdiL (CAAX protease family)
VSRKSPAWRVYLEESREIGLSLLLVLPLLLAYEIVLLLTGHSIRNGAEVVVIEFFRQLPDDGLVLLRRGSTALLMALALVMIVQRPPRVARAHWVMGEALVLALLLGPVVGWLVGGVGLSAPGVGPHAPWTPFLLSIGAGLWEEIVFRLALLGGLTLLLTRAAGLPGPAALGIAVIVSALAFALYHHIGHAGEPLTLGRFAFRAIAGTILGVLFAFRGLAVVVYMHVFYDLLCDLRGLAG